MRFLTVVALLSSIGFGASGARAVDIQLAQTQVQPGAKNPVDIGDLTDFLKKQNGLIEKYQKDMLDAQKGAVEADKMFDEMISAYEQIIAKVGSGSAQAKLFDEYVASCEKFAEEAAGSKNAKIREGAGDYRKFADDARKIKSDFIKESDKAYANINNLKALKEELVDAQRKQKAQEFLASARSQLDVLRETNKKMEDAVKAAKDLKPLS